jgi:hypothetical protein
MSLVKALSKHKEQVSARWHTAGTGVFAEGLRYTLISTGLLPGNRSICYKYNFSIGSRIVETSKVVFS